MEHTNRGDHSRMMAWTFKEGGSCRVAGYWGRDDFPAGEKTALLASFPSLGVGRVVRVPVKEGQQNQAAGAEAGWTPRRRARRRGGRRCSPGGPVRWSPDRENTRSR